jgi:uncharacterized protein
LVHVSRPLRYDLEVQELEKSLLTQGSIELLLECECSRCLKPFEFPVRLDPWALHLPLEGDDATAVINDSVDLTPHIREDMLLGFPQHPLCKPECAGLPPAAPQNGIAETPERAKQGSSAWTDLNKLKF